MFLQDITTFKIFVSVLFPLTFKIIIYGRQSGVLIPMY